MTFLNRMVDWKEFEHLCADLLTAEGFRIEYEPSIDRDGVDIVATEDYRSHDPTRTITIRWRVQCKHYVRSGRNLGRKGVEDALNSFELSRQFNEGLLLMASGDYTEQAKAVIQAYLQRHPDSRVMIWNGRQLEARLDRHPQIIHRYGLSLPVVPYAQILSNLP